MGLMRKTFKTGDAQRALPYDRLGLSRPIFFCFEELEKDVSSNHGIDFGYLGWLC